MRWSDEFPIVCTAQGVQTAGGFWTDWASIVTAGAAADGEKSIHFHIP